MIYPAEPRIRRGEGDVATRLVVIIADETADSPIRGTEGGRNSRNKLA